MSLQKIYTEAKLSFAPIAIENKRVASFEKLSLSIWLVLKQKRAKTIECGTSIKRKVIKPEIP